MSRHRFENISAFLHVVTQEEEQDLGNSPLCKIFPLYESIRKRCFEVYQPLCELSVDERMVKTKARSLLKQFIRNKPNKWGFKFWIVADITGYTIDFGLYGGARHDDGRSEHGLAYDVVMKLIQAFAFQGYEVYCDNFYTSPKLFQDLKDLGIGATGTLNTSRRGVPKVVKDVVTTLSQSDVPRGTGFYLRDRGTGLVYVCWRDTKCITVLSSAHPGSANGCTARRRIRDSSRFVYTRVPQPSAINKYNKYMGGVDKSDQYISYYRILRQTKRYWKTVFYHLVEIGATNAFILYMWRRMEQELKPCTENLFRDELVSEIISNFDESMLEQNGRTHSATSDEDTQDDITDCEDFTIMHGSCISSDQHRCALCHSKTQRSCPDCPKQPPLCQTVGKDCHTAWHSSQFKETRDAFFKRKFPLPRKRVGRPAGSVGWKKRKGYQKGQ